MFKKFVRKTETIEAFQWKGGTVEGIVEHEWTGYHIKGSKGRKKLTPGDYIIKDGDTYRILKPSEFDKIYTEHRTEMPVKIPGLTQN